MLALALLGTLGLAPHHRARHGPAPTVIPLRRLDGKLRSVRLRVGADSADFLFDTGNGTTLVSDSLAARVGCAPVGRTTGFRMTGEKLSGRTCDGFAYEIGGRRVTSRAGLADVAAVLGGDARGLQGVVSLQAFAGRTITLDLAHDRLIVETVTSAARRARATRAVPMRFATGQSGADLDVFVGVPVAPCASAPRGTTLWLEWDSGHQGTTFLAPYAAHLLGVPDSTPRADVALTLGGTSVATPAAVRDVIYDGVLSAGLLERATWTVDLARGRMWVGDVAPLATLSSSSSAVVAPSVDAAGVYETNATERGRVLRSVVVVRREGGVLRGTSRDVGSENVIELRDVHVDGGRLSYRMMFDAPASVVLDFDGVHGTGTWTDTAGHSGALRAVKRS